MTRKTFFRMTIWSLVGMLMAIIFYMSHQPAVESAKTSANLIETILEFIFPSIQTFSPEKRFAIIDNLQFVVRKTAHASIYFMLGGLLVTVFQTYQLKDWHKILLAMGMSLVYAISDEIHQLFIVGRSGQVADVFVDFCGTVVGVLFFFFVSKFFVRKFIVDRVTYKKS